MILHLADFNRMTVHARGAGIQAQLSEEKSGFLTRIALL
jgi:hypothetical protein